MAPKLRFAISQIDCTVGDFRGNSGKIRGHILDARALGAEIIAFPELALTGYPPEDLLLKNNFIDDNLKALEKVAASTGDIVAIVGFVDRKRGGIYNSAAVLHRGKVVGVCHKALLPNYGVFDEKRYFRPGEGSPLFKYGEVAFGVNICEDIWHEEGPLKLQAASGASLIISVNASPYYMNRIKEREGMVRRRARTNGAAIAYVNLIGGQDELVFDGRSMISDADGKIIARSPAFREDLTVVDIPLKTKRKISGRAIVIRKDPGHRAGGTIHAKKIDSMGPMEEVYEALALGLKDYARKNGFKRTVIGLSGGIDSSLVAAIAVDSLGSQNVTGVYMPTRYSSEASETDAKTLASKLGIEFMILSIDHLYKIYLMTLEPKFSGRRRDLTEENVQARIRGNIMMALSNKFGWLVLTTGNKSEMSTGFATLYGDMAGGLAVIKDVPKTIVYRLARYRNSVSGVIPESVIKKEPTAELRPGQKDRDTLPPYPVLDRILKAYIEEDRGIDEIIARGFDSETVKKVVSMVDRSEYKRRQSPPGIKITPKAFGRDRRMPVTNRYNC